MESSLLGRIQVYEKVTIESKEKTYEVVANNADGNIALAVAQTIDRFRSFHNMVVRLQGTIIGDTLQNATLDNESITIADGLYHGRVKTNDGDALTVDLRLEQKKQVVSADFFSGGTYIASMRSHAQQNEGKWFGDNPRFILDQQDSSTIAGSVSIEIVSSEAIKFECTLPFRLPRSFSGTLAFETQNFRILNIEVDKLSGMPWPPNFARSSIPSGVEMPATSMTEFNMESLFAQSGIEARVTHNDADLDAQLGQMSGRPGEEDRWDEREMHEMMDANYSRNLSAREWWLYLLVVTRFDGGPSFNYETQRFNTDTNGNILNDGFGTMGIIFDSRTGAISDPWSEWLPQVLPQFQDMFDFGQPGNFQNQRARQGVAVFWREFDQFPGLNDLPSWDKNRRFLRTTMHELGHALNMAHTWLVNRPASTSFMQYAQNYPVGSTFVERDQNYWRDFDYQFDPEEVFHCRHGFLNEVVPGGRNEFMSWTPSSVFHDTSAGGTRTNLQIIAASSKQHYCFAEPVTFDVTLKNHGPNPVALGKLSPAFGNVRYILKRPDGRIAEYQPPLHKCEIGSQEISGSGEIKHTTSLTVGADGFLFDTPGQYQLTAVIPDPSSGIAVVSQPTIFWVKYPNGNDEKIASEIFNRDCSLYLYMSGGRHLTRARNSFENVADQYSDHPFATHANLVLGLDDLAGQKRIARKNPTRRSNRQDAVSRFSKVLEQHTLPAPLRARLRSTVELCNGASDENKKASSARKRRRS